MRDQSVEEAVGAAGRLALGLCALDLTVEVAGGLLVDVVLVVVLVEVGCGSLSLQCTITSRTGAMRSYRSCRAWKACASASL